MARVHAGICALGHTSWTRSCDAPEASEVPHEWRSRCDRIFVFRESDVQRNEGRIAVVRDEPHRHGWGHCCSSRFDSEWMRAPASLPHPSSANGEPIRAAEMVEAVSGQLSCVWGKCQLTIKHHTQATYLSRHRNVDSVQYDAVDVDFCKLHPGAVPDKLSFICVQFQSIPRHPSTDLLNACNHPGIHDLSSGGLSRTVELDIIGIQVRI